MRISTFNTLEENEKFRIVSLFSTYLARRYQGKYIIDLYSVENFFVELYFNTVEKDIERIITFQSVKKLYRYTKEIKIDSITS